MNILGSFGNLYMAVLLIVLVIGLFYAIYYLLKKTYGYIHGEIGPKGSKKLGTAGGTTLMKTNGWMKLAIFSFVGLIISVVLLNLTNPAYSGGVADDLHNSHVNGTAGTGAAMHGSISGNVSMENMNEMVQRMNELQREMMQMQRQYMNGGMQSNMNMSNSGSMSSSGGMMDDDMMSGGGSMNNMNSGSNGGMGGMM